MKRVLVGALGALALVLAACGNDDDNGANDDTAADTGSAELERVTVGHIPIFISAPLIVGVEEGHFEDEGVEVNLERLAGGADMLVQTAAGNFDIGSGGVGVALFNLVGEAESAGQEIPIEVVAPLHEEYPPATTPLAVSRERYESGEITSVEDLEGMTVSINARGAATEYWLELALNSGGLTMDDIELTTVNFPEVATALENESIDGAMLGEPLATLGQDQDMVTILTDDFVDGEQPTAVYWNRSWAEDNPESAEGFLRGYLRAVERLEDGGWEDDAILEMIEAHTDVPVDVLERASRPYNSGTLDLESFRAQEAFFRGQDLLTYDGELDFEGFMRTE